MALSGRAGAAVGEAAVVVGVELAGQLVSGRGGRRTTDSWKYFSLGSPGSPLRDFVRRVRTALKSASRFRNRTGEAMHCERARDREKRKAMNDDFMLPLREMAA